MFRTRWGWLGLGASFVFMLACVRLETPWLVSAVGDRMARAMRAVSPRLSLPKPGAAVASAAGDVVVVGPLTPASEPSVEASKQVGAVSGRGVQTRKGGERSHVLHISADEASRALGRGLQGATAANAVDSKGHPMGVRLSGVTDLGVGLSDGDVLMSLNGQPTPDVDAATRIGLSALSHGERRIAATVWRGGTTLNVRVDLPVDVPVTEQAKGNAGP